MNIAEIRQKYPQYNDLSDEQLAQGLHKKFYSDMDFGEFSQKIGLAQPQTDKIEALRAELFNSEKAAQRRAQAVDNLKGQALALDEGFTGGWGKKTLGRIAGAVGGGIAGVQNAIDSGNISEIGKGIVEGFNNQEDLRNIQKSYEENNPISAAVTKLGGAVANPLNRLRITQLAAAGKAGKLADFAANAIGQAGAGVGYGLLHNTGTAENAADYFKNGNVAQDVTADALFGAAVPVVGSAIKATAPIATKGLKNALGMITGAGGESVGTAFEAGQRGSKAFADNMRGKVSSDSVVGQAKQALKDMVEGNSELYKSNMAKAFDNTTELDLRKISDSLSDIVNKETRGGDIPLGKDVKRVITEAKEILLPAYQKRAVRTTAGLDKLRQNIYSDIKTDPGTNAHRIKKAIENAIKDTISEQRPEYRKGLRDYARNKAEIEEISKTFSLGDGKSVDTALRKLQSVGRNNVQTNYGYRNALLDNLDFGGDIRDALSGQNFNAVLPRGGVARLLGGLSLYNLNPLVLASSPRLIGEAVYATGKATNKAKQLRDLISKTGLASINAATIKNANKND